MMNGHVLAASESWLCRTLNYEHSLQQSVEGAYYARQLTKLHAQQRIGLIPNNSHLPVMTYRANASKESLEKLVADLPKA